MSRWHASGKHYVIPKFELEPQNYHLIQILVVVIIPVIYGIFPRGHIVTLIMTHAMSNYSGII